jgi:hypothetical protein
MLKISATKVAQAIQRAREHDAVAGSWESQIQRAFHDETADEMLHSFANVPGNGTLAEFVTSLNRDEQVSLLAVAWIGRGAFTPDNLAEAIEAARNAWLSPNAGDLIGIPLLADYLREGMEKLGYSIPERLQSAVFA